MDTSSLSTREKEVMLMIAQAKSRKIIANELSISINTVNSHLRNLHIKTRTHSLAELVVWALENKKYLLQ